MSLFTETEVRARARQERSKPTNLYKSESKILGEAYASFSSYKTYDIFLSHSSKDAELILGVKGILEDLGYSVYVDWIEDPQLDRSNVTKSTANTLRERMKRSKSLFYVTTENAQNSRWMPWECGYFDGLREKVAITPVKKSSYDNEYQGQEYLGLYPYSIKANDNNNKATLWIFRDKNSYTSYSNWVNTPNNEINWQKA